MSYLTTGGSGKEYRTNKLPPTVRIRERSKGEKRCQSIYLTNLPESFSLESILAERWACHQEGPWVRMIGQRQPRNKPHYYKTWDFELCGRAVLLGSLTLLLSTWAPLPNEISRFVSMCVSLDNSFLSVRQEPILRPWKGLPFLQHNKTAPMSDASCKCKAQATHISGWLTTNSEVPYNPSCLFIW